MSNRKSLYDKKVKAKFSALINRINVAPMITGFIAIPSIDKSNVINVLDNEGNVWFISTSRDPQFDNTTAAGRTNLLFNDTATEAMNIVSVYGKATLTATLDVSDFKGNKKIKTWLKTIGSNHIVAIKLVPDEVCFWDTQKKSYTTLFKLENEGVIALDIDDDSEEEIAMSA